MKHKPVKKECNICLGYEMRHLPIKKHKHVYLGKPEQKEEVWKRKFIKAAKQTRYYKEKEDDWGELQQLSDTLYQVIPQRYYLWAMNWVRKDFKRLLKKERERVIGLIEEGIYQQEPTVLLAFSKDEWNKLKKQVVP